jgi:hypothetical protein
LKNTQPQDHFPGGILDGYETETIPEPEPDFGESEYDDSDSGESDDIDSSGMMIPAADLRQVTRDIHFIC